MSGQFLLNLANRSAGKTTVPLARPYLRPLFMPPSPALSVAGAPPAPPMSQKRMPTAQARSSPYSHVMPGQSTADLPRPDPTPQSVPPSPPSGLVPPPMPVHPVEAEQAISPPAEPSLVPTPMAKIEQPAMPAAKPTPDLRDDSRYSGQKPVRPDPVQHPVDKTPSPHSQPDSPRAVLIPPQPLPAIHDPVRQPVRQKDDKFQIQSVPEPSAATKHSVAEGRDRPSPARPAMPLPFIPNRPNPLLTTRPFDGIVTPEPRLKRQASIPENAVPGPPPTASQTAPPESVAESVIRKTSVPVAPDVPQSSNTGKPEGGRRIGLEALPLTTIIARSTVPDAPSPPRPPASPASPASAGIGRVIPAPEQRPSLQSQPVQRNTPQPVQVSIGTVDLRVSPAEPAGSQLPYRRKRPQGFDAFRQRRSYWGWEE